MLLCLPVGLAACGGDDVSRDDLVRAADATRDAGGARIASRGVIAVGIDTVWRFTSAGVRDSSGATDITSRVAVIEGEGSRHPLPARAITVGDTMYFKGYRERRWLKWSAATSSLLAGIDPADPGAIARMSDLADVRRVGTGTVRGIATKHYEATIDLRDLARLARPAYASAWRDSYQRASQQGGGGSLRVDLWVDDNDLIRRIRRRLSTRLTGIDYPPDDQTMELFDFGLDKRVVPPPKRDTETVGPEP